MVNVTEFQAILRNYADSLDEKRPDAKVMVYVPAKGKFLPMQCEEDLSIYFSFRLPEDDE